MRLQKVYLETTMFNYYFDKDRDAHPYTKALFNEIKMGKYLAYTSEYVIAELLKAPENKRSLMLGLIREYEIVVLELSEETERLARIYVKEGIIPDRFMTDGIHIAATTVHDLDMILSLNFKHIVKKKTMELTSLVNIREGYRSIGIFTPMEVVEE